MFFLFYFNPHLMSSFKDITLSINRFFLDYIIFLLNFKIINNKVLKVKYQIKNILKIVR